MSGMQLHWHLSPIALGGKELGPQGLGWQGSTTTGSMMVGGLLQETNGSPM